MMETLISIIVPVYKSEKYIELCVNSILAQTYSNLEILLIDDGSPDCCPKICDELAKKDERVKVVHKSNGGASSARNIGLDYAVGDYICFVDSDDILPQNAISDLLQGIKSNHCQYAAGICGILNNKKVKNSISNEKIIDYTQNPEELLHYITQSGSYSPYSKIFDACVIRKNALRYDENLKCSEDALFIRQYLLYCSRIVLIPQIVYMYNTDNEESLSKKFYPDFCIYYSKKMEVLEKLLQRFSISECVKKNFIFDRAVHGLYISIQHFMIHCNDREQAIYLIGEAINVLNKWIATSGESVSHKKWWSRYADAVQNHDAASIYTGSQKEVKKLNVIYRMRQALKKKIRGIRK